MTIELVTGAPGAGKTCYAVAARLLAESGVMVDVEDESGVSRKVRRRVLVAGIRDLIIEHERLPHTLTGERVAVGDIERWNRVDADGEAVMKRLPGDPPVRSELVDGRVIPLQHTIFNWWLWVMPGDLIAVDEVQYVIPRGALGRVPPHYIKALEVHRHYGCDWLVITQHPQLLDMTIRNLVNPHRHVRAVMGSSLCMVYVWDHASNPERLTLSTKTFFKRKREHFSLYKSTVAVMKQPAAGRKWLMAIPVLVAIAAWRFWGVVHPSPSKPEAVAAASAGIVRSAVASTLPEPSRPQGWTDVPKLAGCYTIARGPCRCQSPDGREVHVAEAMCRRSAAGFDGLVVWEPRAPLPAASAVARAAPSASAPMAFLH